jgi:hypothetical protein
MAFLLLKTFQLGFHRPRRRLHGALSLLGLLLLLLLHVTFRSLLPALLELLVLLLRVLLLLHVLATSVGCTQACKDRACLLGLLLKVALLLLQVPAHVFPTLLLLWSTALHAPTLPALSSAPACTRVHPWLMLVALVLSTIALPPPGPVAHRPLLLLSVLVALGAWAIVVVLKVLGPGLGPIFLCQIIQAHVELSFHGVCHVCSLLPLLTLCSWQLLTAHC